MSVRSAIVVMFAVALALTIGCAAKMRERAENAQTAAREAIEKAEAAGASEQALAEARYYWGKGAKAVDKKRYPKAQRLFRRARRAAHEAERNAADRTETDGQGAFRGATPRFAAFIEFHPISLQFTEGYARVAYTSRGGETRRSMEGAAGPASFPGWGYGGSSDSPMEV